jgi:hypothetical protein
MAEGIGVALMARIPKFRKATNSQRDGAADTIPVMGNSPLDYEIVQSS